ncbi:BTB/POZ domain-containing protein 3-like [Sitodiplosis mosellana]|uniref:BTB/POZ domain-containing protein 3-like n=1 Tax=Sitodiplosis mosellana TaxID=263140 RepID=UPI002443DE31|nr:BTB/POZ domain-containing protein 3-like [Sitodiplosis mosellana]XP_055326196.1 BTB/POZ domain-containing protein 3-like [Sitodiplosis mosellana]
MPVFDPLNSDYATQLLSAIGEKLYLNSELADVHFVSESNDDIERVPAHKMLLMAASDVFSKMFNGSWKEKDEVKIVDMSAAAFKEFLQFFYFGKVKLTMQNVAAVMNLGEMYNVAECLTVCSKFLKNNLNDDNVCQNYGLAILLNQEDLKRSCETVIGLNANSVLKSTGFLSCNQKVLAEILKLNWLSCTEVELFKACMCWVKATTGIDNLAKELVQVKLGDSLYDIRFGSMSFEEFGALVPTYGQLFTTTEYVDIIQMFTNKEFQSNKFNQNREKRCDSDSWVERNEIFCSRLFSRFSSTNPYFVSNLETTKISSNQPLLLKGFTLDFIKSHCNEIYSDCDNLPTEITIVETSGSDESKRELVRYNGKATLTSSEETAITLPKPVLIRPGFMYEIRLKQNPPENCATGVLLKSEVEMKGGINIQFHDDPFLPDDKSPTGLISYLRFCQIGN